MGAEIEPLVIGSGIRREDEPAATARPDSESTLEGDRATAPSGRTEYYIAAAIALVALAISPLGSILLNGPDSLRFRGVTIALALDAFLLLVVGGILVSGRAQKLFFLAIAWTFPVAVLAALEAAAGSFHLAHIIAPFDDVTLLDEQGFWPPQLQSADRFGPVVDGVRLYRPWQGHGIVINELGLRTAPPTPKATGEWRVAITGGSTAWGWRVRDVNTIAAGVQRQLSRAHPNVTVYNYAIEGATMAGELATLKRFREIYAIDQVLFYTGANDTHSTYKRETAAEEEFRRLAEPSSFELVKAVRRLMAMLKGPAAKTLAKLDQDVLPRTAQNNSLRDGIIAADTYCQAVKLRCDFALEPYLPTRKMPVGPEARLARTFELVFPRLGAMTLKMYREAIIAGPEKRVHDLSGLLDAFEKPVFFDLEHMNEAGHRFVAQAIAPIVEQGLPPP
jgi:hypothetical protein